jgi:glutathione peroxidase
VVLGFPCDDFGRQEPADNAGIEAFCQSTFDVTFPLFAKIAIKGADGHPLFKWLAGQRPGILGIEAIKWNFTKFLVDARGTVIKRYGSIDTPEQIRKDVAAPRWQAISALARSSSGPHVGNHRSSPLPLSAFAPNVQP